jgi:hypothetical protein
MVIDDDYSHDSNVADYENDIVNVDEYDDENNDDGGDDNR